jgi:hypothetical protein
VFDPVQPRGKPALHRFHILFDLFDIPLAGHVRIGPTGGKLR